MPRVEKSSYRRFSFDSINEVKHSRGAEVQGGLLKISEKGGHISIPVYPYEKGGRPVNVTFSLNFRLYSDEDMGLFEFNGVELFVYSGKLHLKYGKFYVNTGVTIPPHRWFPLTVSLAPYEGRIIADKIGEIIDEYSLCEIIEREV